MSTLDTLRQLAEIIRTEKEVGANTAERIGNMFLAVINALGEYPTDDELKDIAVVVAQNAGDIKSIKSNKADKAELFGYVTTDTEQLITGMKRFNQAYFNFVPFADVDSQSVQLATKNDVPSIMPLYDSGVEIARVDVGGERVFLYAPREGGSVDLSAYYLTDGSKPITGDLKIYGADSQRYGHKIRFVSDYGPTIQGFYDSIDRVVIVDAAVMQVKGTVVQSSDERLKDILSNEPKFGVDEIAKAPVVYFNWLNKIDAKEHLGTIAQYWKEIAPECVSGKDGNMSLDYSTLGLVSAIVNAREIVRLKELLKEKGYDTDEE